MAGGFFVSLVLFSALATGNIGRIKGSSFWMWFLVGLIPVIGLISAIFYRYDNQELRRQCPSCGRVCMLHDAICMGCGAELEFPDAAIESELSASAGR